MTRHFPQRHKQRGFTLVELMIVAILVSLGIAGGLWTQRQAVLKAMFAAQGDTLKALGNAGGNEYVLRYYGELQKAAPNVPGVADPYRPTMTELRALGLPIQQFSDTGYQGLPYQFELSRTPVSCTPPTCDVTGQIYLGGQITDPSTGKVSALGLGQIITAIGGDGGFSDDMSPSIISGFGGQWSKANPLGSVIGVASMQLGYGTLGYQQFLRRDGTLPMLGALNMQDGSGVRHDIRNANALDAQSILSSGRISTGEYLEIDGLAVENQPCSPRTVGLDTNGLTLSCQSGVWKRAVKSPNMYRYFFTASQPWTVPAGVTSAFVTMAGGGGSGLGWRFASQYITGHSAGFVFSAPVNLVPGETMSVVVGRGGRGAGPVDGGGQVYVPPSDDDGYSGYPGEASKLISPTSGTLIECDGGSGATTSMVNAYNTGAVRIPGPQGSAWAFSSPYIGATPSRPASGPYAIENGPGACGSANYGRGNQGTYAYALDPNSPLPSGVYPGALTPFGYGSGGEVRVSGCYITPSETGRCVWNGAGRDGVVMIDVLY